jgi:Tfp pilus assembly protein PilX
MTGAVVPILLIVLMLAVVVVVVTAVVAGYQLDCSRMSRSQLGDELAS